MRRIKQGDGKNPRCLATWGEILTPQALHSDPRRSAPRISTSADSFPINSSECMFRTTAVMESNKTQKWWRKNEDTLPPKRVCQISPIGKNGCMGKNIDRIRQRENMDCSQVDRVLWQLGSGNHKVSCQSSIAPTWETIFWAQFNCPRFSLYYPRLHSPLQVLELSKRRFSRLVRIVAWGRD